MKARLLLLGTLIFGTALHAAPQLPNIVIIFTDDQGYADVGVFGAKGFQTPNLDRLAREGCKFTNFHVAQPVCSASRAGLLTGCYPNRIGIHGALGPNAKHGLNTNEVTIADLLKSKGYATGMAGKWHLGRPAPLLPIHCGFDEYFGLPYSNDMWPRHPEAKQGTYPPLPLIEDDRVIDSEVTPDEQANLTTWYTERAVKFIERNHDRPFFFYLAHSMPHVPLHVSDKFKGRSKQGLYGDVIMEIDWSVGEIMKALKKYKLDENTWVIFTSDNGPWLSYGNHAGSAGPLREGKGTCWEGGTREPCIMRWPGKIPKGRTSDAMLMTIDLLPSIANVVGAELPPLKIDGLDVWPLIAGTKGAANPHEGYFYYYEAGQLQAVASSDGRWKLQLPHAFRTLPGQVGGTNGIPARYQQMKIEIPELYDLKSDIARPGTSPLHILKLFNTCLCLLNRPAPSWATTSPIAKAAAYESRAAWRSEGRAPWKQRAEEKLRTTKLWRSSFQSRQNSNASSLQEPGKHYFFPCRSMKTSASCLKQVLRLLGLQPGLIVCQTLHAAVGFTVTPSTVSNPNAFYRALLGP